MIRSVHLTLLAVFAVQATAHAQSDSYWEIRPVAGIAVPIGTHRNIFGDAAFAGVASSVRLSASWDLVASFAVNSQTAKYPVSDGHVDVLVYNAGALQHRLLRGV